MLTDNGKLTSVHQSAAQFCASRPRAVVGTLGLGIALIFTVVDTHCREQPYTWSVSPSVFVPPHRFAKRVAGFFLCLYFDLVDGWVGRCPSTILPQRQKLS